MGSFFPYFTLLVVSILDIAYDIVIDIFRFSSPGLLIFPVEIMGLCWPGDSSFHIVGEGGGVRREMGIAACRLCPKSRARCPRLVFQGLSY